MRASSRSPAPEPITPTDLDHPEAPEFVGTCSPDLKNRRGTIVAALRGCMISKGYAGTSLAALAESAEMSVSHLLYYYSSKEAVLNDLCDQVIKRVLADVTAYHSEPPEERIHILVDNVFIQGALTQPEFGIIRELTALSVHRPELRLKLSDFNRAMIAYLEDLFSKVPRPPGLSALDAAEIAGALWMGLFNNAEFDERLSHGLARRLFRRTLLSLANLGDRPTLFGQAVAGCASKPRTRKIRPTR